MNTFTSGNKDKSGIGGGKGGFRPPQRLSVQIADFIGNRIIRGEYRSGEWIKEKETAEEMGVGRGLVREALVILEGRRLVHIVPRHGPKVAELVSDEVASLFDILIPFYSMLVSKAADSDKIASKMDVFADVLGDMDQHVIRGDVGSFFDKGFEFEESLYPLVNSYFLTALLSDLQPVIRRTYYYTLNLKETTLNEHIQFFKNLVIGIRSHSYDHINTTVREYLSKQRDFVVAHLRQLEEEEAKAER